MSAASASPLRPCFHLAFPVDDLERARKFYAGALGCSLGPSTEGSQAFDWQGHQLVAILSRRALSVTEADVDGLTVPDFHFGLIVEWADFGPLLERLRDHGVPLLIEPDLPYPDHRPNATPAAPADQRRLLVRDPSGNTLVFKAYRRSAGEAGMQPSPPC